MGGCIAAAVFDFGQGTKFHHGWGGFGATCLDWAEVGHEGEPTSEYKEQTTKGVPNGTFKLCMTTGDAVSANLAEVGFVIAWSGGLTLVIMGALKLANLLRVEEDVE